MRRIAFVSLSIPVVVSLYAACSDSAIAPTPVVDAGIPNEAALLDKRPVLPDVVAADAATCFPGDVSGFMPTWTPPVHDLNACSDVQIAELFAKCFDKATSNKTNCTAWLGAPANKVCSACLYTPDTAKALGVLISHPGYTSINVAGCEAIILNDVSPTGCAAKDSAQSQCVAASCAANCPVTDAASLTEFTTCETAAGKAQCKTYSSARCDLSDAGPALAVCSGPYADFPAFYAGVAPVFCGGKKVVDAGASDSGSD